MRSEENEIVLLFVVSLEKEKVSRVLRIFFYFAFHCRLVALHALEKDIEYSHFMLESQKKIQHKRQTSIVGIYKRQ
jgi:hypothetical protein